MEIKDIKNINVATILPRSYFISNNEYIDWLEKFSKSNNIIGDWLSNLSTINEIDRKNLKNFPIFFQLVDTYAFRNWISPKKGNLGYYYSLEYNNNIYEIGIFTDKNPLYFWKKSKDKTAMFKFEDIKNNKNLKHITEEKYISEGKILIPKLDDIIIIDKYSIKIDFSSAGTYTFDKRNSVLKLSSKHENDTLSKKLIIKK